MLLSGLVAPPRKGEQRWRGGFNDRHHHTCDGSEVLFLPIHLDVDHHSHFSSSKAAAGCSFVNTAIMFPPLTSSRESSSLPPCSFLPHPYFSLSFNTLPKFFALRSWSRRRSSRRAHIWGRSTSGKRIDDQEENRLSSSSWSGITLGNQASRSDPLLDEGSCSSLCSSFMIFGSCFLL